MAPRIVPLDVLKLRRVSKRWDVPVEVPQPSVNVRVARADVTNVALEMLNVHRIKANDGRIPLPQVSRARQM